MAGLTQLLNRLGVVAEILLATDKNDGQTLAEMQDLGDPLWEEVHVLAKVAYRVQSFNPKGERRKKQAYLLLNVVEGVGGVDGEADQDDVGVGVRKGTETVVIFLASRIPKGQLDVLAINLDIGDVVLENGGNVDLN